MARDEEVVIRPGTIVLTLVLMGITTLFAGLCAAYIYTLVSTGIDAPRPPILFFVNIPVLYVATRMLKKSKYAFDVEEHPRLMTNLILCLLLSLIFIILQVIGWIQFFQNISIEASQTRSFLFVLSALHLLHVFAGIPFLVWFFWKCRSDIFLFANVNRRSYLRGLIRYWNYLDVLWIILVIMLTIGYLIKWL